MVKDTLFTNNLKKTKRRKQEKQHLHKLATKISRQQINNSNNNSTNNNTQRLPTDQLAKRTRLQRGSKDVRTAKAFEVVHSSQQFRVFILFPTGRDVTWKSLEKSGSRLRRQIWRLWPQNESSRI
ncbi:hypothetical protein AVEN_184700-1 [Araneus ventricosus]|uniref:Uncharacterized protein n=1 Tax=Araneus ventricosus TaxID=182803 RepID=A0A4Y2RGU3_ARAVE|nr:hypothetical protein AVEN_184700-1 [Araneus ventricosus]